MKTSVLLQRFFKFGLVGGMLFLFDAALFTGLLYIGVYPVVARVLSVVAAILLSWLVNRAFTFGIGLSGLRVGECIKFAVSQCPGALANAGASLLAYHYIPYAESNPWLSVAIGSCVGLVFNFCMANFFVFRNAVHAKQP